MTTPDPVVEEVRRVREQFAREHGFDLRRIYDAIKASESKRGSKLIAPPRHQHHVAGRKSS